MPQIAIGSIQEAERYGITVIAEEPGAPWDRTLSVVVCIPRRDDLPRDLRVVFATLLQEERKTLLSVAYEPQDFPEADGSHYIASMLVDASMLDRLYMEMLYLDDKEHMLSDPPGGFRFAMASVLERYEEVDYMDGLAKCGFRYER